MEDGKPCKDCNGLKISNTNGRTRIEVPEDFGDIAAAGPTWEQLAAVNATFLSDAERPIRIERVEPSIAVAATVSVNYESRGQNFTLADTDAADVLGLFQQDDQEASEPDRFPTGVRDPLSGQVGQHLKEDDKVAKALEKLKKQDSGDEDCDCVEWTTDWTTTDMELEKVVRGVKTAQVPERAKGEVKAGEKDENTAPVTITVYDVYTYRMEGTWKLCCSRSSPRDCAVDWCSEGTWDDEFTVDVQVDQYAEDVTYKISKGIDDKAKKKIEKKHADGGKEDKNAKGEVPERDWPKGAVTL